MKKLVSVPLPEDDWTIFVYGNQEIIQTPIDKYDQIPKAIHQGILQTKTKFYFLNLRQEEPINICTHEGNTNKGY